MIFDLHTHSTASDGHLSPEQLLDRAVNNGVSHLALTDHDTMAGFEQLQNGPDLKSRWPIHLVPGVEISASIDQQPLSYCWAMVGSSDTSAKRLFGSATNLTRAAG